MATRVLARSIAAALRAARATAPAGVTFRAWRDREDFAAVMEVFHAGWKVDGLDFDYPSIEDLELIYRSWEADPATSLILAERFGRSVGWVRMFAFGEGRAGRLLDHRGYVTPGDRRAGIGGALLSAAQAHLLRTLNDHPIVAGTQAVLASTVSEREVGAIAMLERDGYAAASFTVQMVRALDDSIVELPLPRGVEVRDVRPTEAMTILQAMNEEPIRHGGGIMSDLELERLLEWNHAFDIWRVAWAGDEVVGGVLGWIDDDENAREGRRRGYTEFIFTRAPWRGRGVASALISRNLRLLRERGMAEAALGVDTDNPHDAMQLYLRHGFVEEHRSITYHKAVAAAR